MRSAAILLRAACFAALVLPPLFAGAAQPEGPGLSLSARPGSVPVGGTFTLVLTYALPPGANAAPTPEIRGIEGLSVVKRGASRGRVELSVVADSLDPIRIGPLELGYTGPDGKKAALRSGVLTVNVTSSLKGAEEPRPIRGIVPTKGFLARWGPAMGAVLLALGLFAGVVHAWRRWKGRGGASAPAEPPHARAEREVEALLKEGLFEQGRAKEFYFRFTGIARRYLEALWGFPASESTTEEIASRITEADRPLLAILRRADLVKFADGEATQVRRDEDVSAFLAYLDVTSPRASEEGTVKGEAKG